MSVKVRNKTNHPRVIRDRASGDEVQVQPRAETRLDDKYLDDIDTSLFNILKRPNESNSQVQSSVQRNPKTTSTSGTSSGSSLSGSSEDTELVTETQTDSGTKKKNK